MQAKTTRAFRTIGEAADELGLQPHVLRFWESKFSQIRPIKRAGGRRLYRAEDIELLRGIKILLHEEKHPIKDVQKIIRIKGAGQVVELGRSIKKAAIPKPVKDTVLVPERLQRIAPADTAHRVENEAPAPTANSASITPIQPVSVPNHVKEVAAEPVFTSKGFARKPIIQEESVSQGPDLSKLRAILARLEGLKSEWDQLEN